MTTSHAIPRVTGTTSSAREARLARLPALLGERILVLDGAMGTLLQRHAFTEADFRGVRFADHDRDVRGDNDLLCLTQPDAVREVHRAYLAAGADIISTNSFTATRIAQADYNLGHVAREINEAAARLARGAADESEARDGRPRYVAGALGPTNRTASLSPDVNDPAARNVSFDELAEAYREAAEGQVTGGADLLLLETIFDTLNAKAAIFAIHGLFEDLGFRLPLVISGTIVDASGRTLSGQTLEAFWTSIRHADPLLVGLNCALGPRQLREHVEELSRLADVALSAYPNAGLPNELGGYDETPEEMAQALGEWARAGLLNVAGSCCGSTPEHTAAIAAAVAGMRATCRPHAWHGHPPGRTGAAHHPDARRGVRQRRRADQRHGLAQVRAADGRCRGRGPCGRGRGRGDRPGPGRERRRDDRRQHGRGDARRRRRHDPVPASSRRGARYRRRAGDGGQLQVVRHRGRPAPAPGARRRQLDQPQGGRGGVPAAGAPVPAVRRRGRCDGVRRAWPGRLGRAPDRGPDAGPTGC